MTKLILKLLLIEEGGEKIGTTPKHLFLQSIADCTGQIIVMMPLMLR